MKLLQSRLAVIAALGTPLLLAGCFQKSPEQFMQSAQEALDKGDVATATIELKNALQAAPDLAQARFLLARALYERGDLTGTGIELDKAMKGGYAGDGVTALHAKLMLARGQSARVLTEFAQTQLASAPEMADLQATLAMAYGEANQLPKALEEVETSLKLAPGRLRAQVAKVHLLLAAKRIDEAKAALEALLAAHGKDARAWRAKGDLLVSTGHRREAVEALRQAATLDPNDISSRNGAFTLLMEANDITGAAAELDKLKAVAPRHPQTFFDAAVLAFARRDSKAATEAIQQVQKLAPTDPSVLMLAGRIGLQSGALQEAEAALGKLVADHPDHDGARALLAQAQLRRGDTEKALATLRPALAEVTKNPASLAVAAEAYMLAGDTKRAEDYFALIAEANPKDVRSRVVLALAKARRGQFEQGVADLRALAAQDPGMAANFALVNLHMESKDQVQALADIAGLQRKVPGSPLPAQLRGATELMQGHVAEARQAFEAALKLDSAYYPAVAALVKLDVDQRDYGAAATRLQQVLARDPQHMRAQMTLAHVRQLAGAPLTELVSMLEKAIQQSPTEAEPRLTLVKLLLQHNHGKEALAAAQNAAAALPENADIQAVLARAQAKTGDLLQATASLNKQVSLAPNSPQALVSLAELYARRGDGPSAMKTLKRALLIKPDFLPAQIALIAASANKGDYAEARSIAQTVRQQHPNDAVGAVLLGDIEAAQKHWDAAVSAYRSALTANSPTELALKLHPALVKTGNAGAVRAFEAEWLETHAKDVVFLLYLGDRAINQKDMALAEQRYQAVLKIEPNDPMALNNLAWLLSEAGRSEALDLAERANKVLPDRPPLLDTLAQIHAKAGRLDKAIDIEKRAVALAPPDNPRYRLALARLYLSAGQKAAAKEELTKLARMSEALPQQQEAKKLLGML
ncbi:PEP-CTERM system TPR-repeat protein PrsT [Paucibacter sp. R3-3]|uniref:PEP-CTERM system TPR-repeat protein PrsT n=1 Tax=Roseateles agri TaxID=3098619 RepID=A0ABU5DNC4_9BURK|nr:XrtA/PEP-CTERM system TPR-repeat protein PrsT [Paucibacter sp. R3-3]MDY0747226.1 PEP-CTERM system TPR-repeat protein PrsT [Paucibacter sp. R3-3]